MTSGRLKRLKKYLGDNFLMSYGDGLSSVNVNKLVKDFIKKIKKKFYYVDCCRCFSTSKIWGN